MWHSLAVPPDAELMRILDAGPFVFTLLGCVTDSCHTEGLQATMSETVIQKQPQGKKKGKKGQMTRTRQTKIMNTHLKDEGIDLSHDFHAQPKK